MTGKKVALAKALSLATLYLLSKRLHGLAGVTGRVTRLLLQRRKGVMLG
jgi:hypothetical protein